MKQSTGNTRKERYVYHVFQEIAEGYDRANQRISLGAHMRWKKKAAAFLIRRMPGRPHILDLGCGTGDMLRIFYEMNSHADLTGLDFSPHMLKIAGRNCRDINKLTLIRGNALKIPLPDVSFDGVAISFALRNTADYDKVLKEAYRVLKPGGIFICLDSFVPESPLIRPFYHIYFSCIMPFLGGGVRRRKAYQWLTSSTKAFISVKELKRRMSGAGYRDLSERSFLFGASAFVAGRK